MATTPTAAWLRLSYCIGEHSDLKLQSASLDPLLSDAVDVAGIQEDLSRPHSHYLVVWPIRLLQRLDGLGIHLRCSPCKQS